MDEININETPNNEFIFKRKTVIFVIEESQLKWTVSQNRGKTTTVPLVHVVGIELIPRQINRNAVRNIDTLIEAVGFKLHYSIIKNDKCWQLQTVSFSGSHSGLVFQKWETEIMKAVFLAVPTRPKKVLIVINNSAGKCKAATHYDEVVQPLLNLAKIHADPRLSISFDDVKEKILQANLEDIDSVIAMGGDGTFSQCMNGVLDRSLRDKNQSMDNKDTVLEAPRVILGYLPSGTGQGMAMASVGVVDLLTSTLQIISGLVVQRPLFAVYNGERFIRFGFLLATYGISSGLIYYSEQNRSYGRLRYPICAVKSYRESEEYSARTEVRCRGAEGQPEGWNLYPRDSELTTYHDWYFLPHDMVSTVASNPEMSFIRVSQKSAIPLIRLYFKLKNYKSIEEDEGLIPRICQIAGRIHDVALCTGLKVTVSDYESQADSLHYVNIDGDVYSLNSEDIEIRSHFRGLTTYGHHPDPSKRPENRPSMGMYLDRLPYDIPPEVRAIHIVEPPDEAAIVEHVHNDDENAQNDGEIVRGGEENAQNDGEIVGSAEENAQNDGEIVGGGEENAQNEREIVGDGEENAQNGGEIVGGGKENAQNDGEIVRGGEENAQNVGEDAENSETDTAISLEAVKPCFAATQPNSGSNLSIASTSDTITLSHDFGSQANKGPFCYQVRLDSGVLKANRTDPSLSDTERLDSVASDIDGPVSNVSDRPDSSVSITNRPDPIVSFTNRPDSSVSVTKGPDSSVSITNRPDAMLSNSSINESGGSNRQHSWASNRPDSGESNGNDSETSNTNMHHYGEANRHHSGRSTRHHLWATHKPDSLMSNTSISESEASIISRHPSGAPDREHSWASKRHDSVASNGNDSGASNTSIHHSGTSNTSRHDSGGSKTSRHDSGGSNTSRHHSGASDTTRHDTGTSNTSIHDTGASNTSIHDTGASNTGIHDTGASNTGIHDTGASNTSIHDTGASDTSRHDTGALKTSRHNTGASNPSMHDTGASDTGRHIEVSDTCKRHSELSDTDRPDS